MNTNGHEEKMGTRLSSCSARPRLARLFGSDILNGTGDQVSKCRRKFCDKFYPRIQECRLVVQAHHGTVATVTPSLRIEADGIVNGTVNGATELNETMSQQNADKPLVLKQPTRKRLETGA